jgi:hypothetical protein
METCTTGVYPEERREKAPVRTSRLAIKNGTGSYATDTERLL